jgi:hypothetical protein
MTPEVLAAMYELVKCARAVVDTRGGDIRDEDRGNGNAATCDVDNMIRLEMAIEQIDELCGKAIYDGAIYENL